MMQSFQVTIIRWRKKLLIHQLRTYLSRANLNMVGPTITYYTLISLVPVLMSVGSIAGLVGINSSTLTGFLKAQLPTNVMDVLNAIIVSVLQGSVGILSFSIIVTIWGASSVLAVIRKAFNTVHDVPEKINGLLTRVFSFLWLMFLLLAASIVMGLGALLPTLVNMLPFKLPWLIVLAQQSWLITLVGLWILLCLFNFALPAKPLTWRAIMAGSFIEVILIIILNQGFSWYAQFAVKSIGFYQSLGSLLVLMVYLNLVGTILVITQIIIGWFDDLRQAWRWENEPVPMAAKGVSASHRQQMRTQYRVTKH